MLNQMDIIDYGFRAVRTSLHAMNQVVMEGRVQSMLSRTALAWARNDAASRLVNWEDGDELPNCFLERRRLGCPLPCAIHLRTKRSDHMAVG